MDNPILQMLNGSNTNNILNRINGINQMLSGKDPNVLFNQMMQTNPKFSQFVNDNKGKTPEQIARSYGIDPAVLNRFVK